MSNREVAAKLGLKCPRCGNGKLDILKFESSDDACRMTFTHERALGNVRVGKVELSVKCLCSKCATVATVTWEQV